MLRYTSSFVIATYATLCLKEPLESSCRKHLGLWRVKSRPMLQDHAPPPVEYVSAPHPTFCAKYPLTSKNSSAYASPVKKQCLIDSEIESLRNTV